MQGESELVLSLIPLGAGMVLGRRSLELLHGPERPPRAVWHRNSQAVPTCAGQSFWAQRRAYSSLNFNSSPPPLLLPLSCVSAPSLPKFPSFQPQAFHRGNISAETEGSEEQVATGMFADWCFSERGCFGRTPPPTSALGGDGSTTRPPSAPLPSPAFPGSPRALAALLKGFELQTSAKNPGGKALHSGSCVRLLAPTQQPPNCCDYILESQCEGKLLGSFEAPGLV